MVKNVRCYKCLAEIDRISQEMCVERPEDGESLTLSLRVYQATATQRGFLLQNLSNHKTGYCPTPVFHSIVFVVFFSPKVSSLPHEDNVKTTTSATQTKTQRKPICSGANRHKKIVFMWVFFSLLKSRYSCIIHNKPPEKQTFRTLKPPTITSQQIPLRQVKCAKCPQNTREKRGGRRFSFHPPFLTNSV